jgi:hypothetical protein
MHVNFHFREHAGDLKRRNRQRRLSLKQIENIQNKEFPDWFRGHVCIMVCFLFKRIGKLT